MLLNHHFKVTGLGFGILFSSFVISWIKISSVHQLCIPKNSHVFNRLVFLQFLTWLKATPWRNGRLKDIRDQEREKKRDYIVSVCVRLSVKATHWWVWEDRANLSTQSAITVKRLGGGKNCVIWCPACHSPKPAMVWMGEGVARDSCPKRITGQHMSVKGHLDTHTHIPTHTHSLHTQVREQRRLVRSAFFTPCKELKVLTSWERQRVSEQLYILDISQPFLSVFELFLTSDL